MKTVPGGGGMVCARLERMGTIQREGFAYGTQRFPRGSKPARPPCLPRCALPVLDCLLDGHRASASCLWVPRRVTIRRGVVLVQPGPVTCFGQ